MAGKAMFYPGCSVEQAGGYLESIMVVADKLNIEMPELPDWNCCGATMFKAYDRKRAAALVGRNLAIAAKHGADTLITICNACLATLLEEREMMKEDRELREAVAKALKAEGYELCLDVEIVHLLDYIVNEVGIDMVKELTTRPLKGHKYAPYYGCLFARPPRPKVFLDNPMCLDQVIEALGAKAVEFAPKLYCCGASQAAAHPKTAYKLVADILRYAKNKGADAIVTICPLCNFNLGSYQDKQIVKEALDGGKMPVVFFTQIMGLAFGYSMKEVGLDKLLVPPEEAAASA